MLELRYIVADDRHIPYIAHSWMTSFKNAPAVRGLEDDVYFPWMKKHVAGILKSATSIVAVDPNDDDVVIGYVVFEKKTLHYGYVRHGYRKTGIFQELITRAEHYDNGDDPISYFSHQSSAWDPSRTRWRYRPFFL